MFLWLCEAMEAPSTLWVFQRKPRRPGTFTTVPPPDRFLPPNAVGQRKCICSNGVTWWYVPTKSRTVGKCSQESWSFFFAMDAQGLRMEMIDRAVVEDIELAVVEDWWMQHCFHPRGKESLYDPVERCHPFPCQETVRGVFLHLNNAKKVLHASFTCVCLCVFVFGVRLRCLYVFCV